ncbi:MAG: aminoacyl-tRNA hydrolase, partial [Planctomycetes bacterium]|nr:aminoacyl-tRNA hydrolase [Planctomycetota bacterium]
AGFWFLDRLAASTDAPLRPQSKLHAEIGRASVYGHDCILARPTTFMNLSGQAVRAVMDYYRIGTDHMLVAYDELDLPPGVARLKQGGGHGGHNGLRDIFRHTEDHDFLRLRIGIGHPGSKDAVTPYVLGRASADQERLIQSAIGRALEVMPRVLDGNVSGAMNDLHTVTDDGI